MARLLYKFFLIFLLSVPFSFTQTDSTATKALKSRGFAVYVSGDTLFYISASIGPFSAQQRADEINKKLNRLIKTDFSNDSLIIEENEGITNIVADSIVIMSLTNNDAAILNKNKAELALEYKNLLQNKIKTVSEEYSSKRFFINIGIAVGLLVLILLLFYAMRKLFPKIYIKFEHWEGKFFRTVYIRGQEVITAESISAFFIVVLKLIRLALSLLILYYFLIYLFSLFPYTRFWNLRPILKGLISAILVIAVSYAVIRLISTISIVINKKFEEWKGTVIQPVKVKNLELLSEDRIIEALTFFIKILKFFLYVIIAYFFFTLIFSFFDFTKNWASTLIGYITIPFFKVFKSFVKFLPNLFYIIVIVFVTRYILKFIQFIFLEIGKGTVALPQFPQEWAEPTYKIVRFLVIAFALVVIFPYLPGSDSEFFKGVSVFLGILFSLGSTSAIANMVGGIVITYMRPFKIGDRVKIADTTGDIIEKTLLVTRIRTVKNVDVTIPNSMVLGSHIINFSSSAGNKGLILHTTVTIGYDAPWRKVHELLKKAAAACENISKTPEPFILQTALNDFYVSYELNAYTNEPGIMAKIYSELHQNIQDKFNEAGIEIMSPHFSGMRDGNKTQIPDDYLPKNYEQPAFKIFPFGDLGNKKNIENKNE